MPDPLDAARKRLAAGQRGEALAEIDRLLQRQPRHVDALVQRSLVLIMMAQYDDALAAATQATLLAPGDPNAHSYRGSALLQLGQLDEALAAYDRVIALAPKAAVAHYNRANALRRLGRWDEALPSLQMALEVKPDYPDALTLAGLLTQSAGDRDTALHCFDEALRLNPQAADAHYNRGLLLLAMGRLHEGWEEYEWRLRWETAVRQGQSHIIERVAPDWDGQSLQQALLVLPEQGIGDQIFYAGMLADLDACMPGATVCTEQRLQALLTRSFKHLHFTTPEQLPSQGTAFGAQIHMGSLGRIFRRQADDLARIQTGYLKADAVRTSALRARVSAPGKIICGLSWLSKNPEFGRNKSLSLKALAPVLAIDGIEFVDLQYGDSSAERQAMAASHGIAVRKLDDIDNFNDIDSLASLIDACDIVLTVSNTTAHLAAALGKPALVLVPASSSLFWYWHVDGTDSPWYPSAVLLRQSAEGNWTEALETAALALAAFAGAKQ
jgi:tetratricopeptide (TPR) repeat protein